MSMNWWGVALSYVFVFGVIGIASWLLKSGRVTATVSRKLVHIGVSHWWFLAMLFFDRWQFAVIGPVSFILINLASYLFRLMPAMEHEVRSRNLGTIYFPISLLGLVLLGWAGPLPVWVAGMGILVLGYGDGLASLFGQHFNSRAFRIFGNTKSVLGTIVMFVASVAVVAAFIALFQPPAVGVMPAGGTHMDVGTLLAAALATGAVATAVELFTPWGGDNLSIPIVTSLFYFAVFA